MSTYVIGGMVRSGSTLLSSLLSRATGGFDCGELHLLWRSLEDGRLCTCGTRVAECVVWRPVSQRVLKNVGARSFTELGSMMSGGMRQRELLKVAPAEPPKFAVEVRAALEGALREHVGSESLIDSSKLAVAASIALRTSSHTKGIHLLRDPRAVAYSLSHPHKDPSVQDKAMESFGSAAAATMWLSTNLAMRRLARMYPSQVSVLTYEELAARPTEVIKELTGGDIDALAFTRRENHAIAGNPTRFHRDQRVTLDVRWRTPTYATEARRVWFLTGWLARRYGYRRVRPCPP
jgi:hypothetical protein